MKRIFGIVSICMIMGCAGNAEWLKHDTAFASGTHWYFSWWGYRNADMEDVRLTQLEGWWGSAVFVENKAVREGGGKRDT